MACPIASHFYSFFSFSLLNELLQLRVGISMKLLSLLLLMGARLNQEIEDGPACTREIAPLNIKARKSPFKILLTEIQLGVADMFIIYPWIVGLISCVFITGGNERTFCLLQCVILL